MHVELSHTIDLTGIATIVLAAGTFVLAFATRRQARTTTEQSLLLRQQLAIEQRQLAQTYRPIVVTLGRYLTGEVDQDGDPEYVRTVATETRAVVPVENAGTGPALNLTLTVTFPGGRYTNQRAIPVLSVGDQTELTMVLSDEMRAFFAPAADIEVEIGYEGVTGARYHTGAAYGNGRWHSLKTSELP